MTGAGRSGAAVGGGVRGSVLVVLLGLLAVGASLPWTPSDALGAQADNTVLGVLAVVAAVRTGSASRGRTGRWRATGWAMTVMVALFAVACLVTGSGVAGAFGVAGVGDLLLVPVLVVPLVVCTVLAHQVSTSRWVTLAVDGVAVVLALAVVTDVLALHSPDLTQPVSAVTLGYAGYAVVAVGLTGALCTVSTRDLQRTATAMVVASVGVALATAMLAVGNDRPTLLWQALGDAASVVALEACVVAVRCMPRARPGRDDVLAQSPRVVPAGLLVTVLSLGGLPVALAVAAARGQQLTTGSLVAVAGVVALLLVRSTLRLRTSARLVADAVRAEEDLRSLVEGSTDGVVVVDDALRVQFASPAARALLGLPDEAGDPAHLPDLVLAEDRERVAADLRTGAAPSLHLRVPDVGQPTELEVTAHPRADGGRRVLHLRDVTVRRRRERELERMAYTDHLTQLPNRARLFRELAVPAGDRCLLVLDLDGFKAVNDVAGHEAGDHLLVEVARRLRSVVREQDLVVRLGGDEFAVVVAGTLAEAVEAAERVVDVAALPHRAAGRTFAIGASVGVAPVGGAGGQHAFREADDALRAAKAAGKGCVRVQDDGAVDGDDTVTAALAEGRVELRYSVTGSTGDPRSLHAEPFWHHTVTGLRPPAELWAAAGREGCDAALQAWVLDRACRDTAPLPGIRVLAVDLPAGHVAADQLVADVRRALDGSGLAPGTLSLALTEAALQTSPPALPPALRELHALGVRICLDDYGLGQTIHAHLSRAPLTSVRIDVAALGARGDEELTRRSVRAIVATCTAYGLDTVAHGVSPGPLLDAVLAAGVQTVRTRADLHHVTVEQVRRELRPGAEGARILAR
ncbi:PAS domain S-box-containing protein/diguanylate cyclase (GGDEF) domain-containing protein [Klenkia marina]|uniref:PAS domain S-box-containing protein/diguanylate cyclase (GGDEF) domain-containing protein n=1 Tax=Klenkia marina TaxID=1960309 RepID=A0A1G4XHP5_9ACTN|nr:diguanylate cyclase [Klenkia marina]SCX40218.1 PAS domain S-box-containing protein/diguanylate cyclase (GGDEF) domain-containing protein [Klenkia marina]